VRSFKPGDHVQSAFWHLQSEMIAEELIELLDKNLAPLGVDFPHSSDVAEEKSLGNEPGQCSLINRRRVLVHRAADFYQRIDQHFGRNDVTESQGRIENFTHRSGVNDTPEVVDSLQTRKRWSRKTELRIKVIFKNKCIVSTRKIEQSSPSLETHCDPERILMRRSYMDDFRSLLVWRSGDYDA